MDWLKLSIERLFAFLATLIPGSAILLLFVLHRQPALETLWKTVTLSYETKVAITLLCIFAVGLAVQNALSRLGGGVGGFIRGYLGPHKSWTVNDDPKPWRDPVWRSLLTAYLGSSAPKDVPRINDAVYQQNLELIKLGQPDEVARRTLEAFTEKSNADAIDYQWSTWWRQLHVPALLGRHSSVATMMATLSGNFQSASAILLLSMPWTATLRQWWLMVFCLYWIVSGLIDAIFLGWWGSDLWSSFDGQLEYLESQIRSPREKP